VRARDAIGFVWTPGIGHRWLGRVAGGVVCGLGGEGVSLFVVDCGQPDWRGWCAGCRGLAVLEPGRWPSGGDFWRFR